MTLIDWDYRKRLTSSPSHDLAQYPNRFRSLDQIEIRLYHEARRHEDTKKGMKEKLNCFIGSKLRGFVASWLRAFVAIRGHAAH